MERFNIDQLKWYVENYKFSVEKHKNEDLYIYGYHSSKEGKRIVWDDVNKHLRGIILNGAGEVVARPFAKFFTFKDYLTKRKIILNEGDVMRLPECRYRIYEKVDGSMATLYWVGHTPYLASQRSFDSPNAKKATEILHKKYHHLFPSLRKDVTYIFEAIYPETRVMVDYDNREDLVLLGVIETKTGIDLPVEDIGFPIAKDYTQEYGHITDFQDLANLNLPNIEGFVIAYENGVRIKIKFPWFSESHLLANKLLYHRQMAYESKRKISDILMLDKRKISNLLLWEMIKEKKPIEALLTDVDEYFFSYGFEFWLKEMLNDLYSKFEMKRLEFLELSDIEIWELVKPDEELEFNVRDREPVPEFSTPMWNLLNRLQTTFL